MRSRAHVPKAALFSFLFIISGSIFLTNCKSGYTFQSLGFQAFTMELPISLIGPPFKEFKVDLLSPSDLKKINADGFIPRRAYKILVSEDGYLAGLYQGANSAMSLDNLSMSPDGQWSAQRRTALFQGTQTEVLDVGRISYSKRNAWAIGRFKTCLWSPDNRALALNEERPSGRQTSFLLPLETSELQSINLEVDGLIPFFTPDQLATAQSTTVRRWVSGSLLIVWVFGPKNAKDGIAEWGYEVLFDRTRAGSPNARILRAFVCNQP